MTSQVILGVIFLSHIYIYIIFKWRNYCYIRIIMTRKSGKHLHAIYGTRISFFDFIGSHQQCTP